MGKAQKGKGKPGQKPNNKFKQRSPQNLKQLAKVQQILKGRSQSRDYAKGPRQAKFDKKGKQGKFSKDNKNFSKDNKNFSRDNGKFSKDNGKFSKDNSKFQRGNSKGKQFSRQRSEGRNFQKKSNNWQQRPSNKTKQISKPYGKKNYRNDEDEQQKVQIGKGNPLFKIVPQSMDADQFAALGGNSDQQQLNEQEINSDEFNVNGQQYDGQQQDEQQFDEQDLQGGQQQEMEEQDNQEDQDNEDQQLQGDQDQQQMEGQQQQNQQEEQEIDLQGQNQQGQQEQAQQNEQQNIEEENLPEQQEDKQPVDISVISLKIQQTIQILMNVQKLGGGKPRKHFIQELKQLVHQYYGYNFELITHFLDFLNPSEMIQFLEANQTQRPLTIRTNTLKTRRKQLAQNLIQRGVNLDPLADWSKVGIKIYDTKVPIGATPQYLAGHYMLQSASSLLPVIALDPQAGQKVLDMASAPGGKTTYIAQLMKNTGCIFANDLKKERLRALQFNLYRLGVTNTAVTCKDGRKFPSIFPGTFDRVLLDAPCTGLGIISKDHSIKANRLLVDIYKNSHLQKQLLLAAIDSCKVNGVVVYSTCSVSPLQNQQVVNYALKRRFIKIVDCGVDVGQQGLTKFVEKRFHVDLKKTRRIYPHVHNMDGFYVAKLVKVAKGKKETKEDGQQRQQRKIDNYEDVQIQEADVDV